MINKLLNTDQGAIIISIILGLGLASLFRNICKDGRCIIYKSDVKEIQKNYYKLDDSCFKYKPNIVPCENN
jgi:hypothetical protein